MIAISPWIAPVSMAITILVLAVVLRRNEEKKRRSKKATAQAIQQPLKNSSDSLASMNPSSDFSEQGGLPRQGKAVGSVR